ncbi:MAG: DNA polymerase III subunit gamma/tau [Brevinematales bacterium]|nr:DNA polymerase III subunit gamma/tau [Brevinematales bacterium]
MTARKWRPQRFDALVGQEALAQALKHALQTGKTAHAYLFSGIRGVGKTSTARLLAKALNCLSPQEGEPCNQCPSCLSINEGSAIDVIEIDGASNRGIDAIRDLKETVNYLPVKLRYKVYIIDEVHMLTTEASNALLKTLEEPPSHAVFILATTEVHKLLPTIRSRCQHYVFKKIPVTKITNQLMTICEAEGYQYEKEALSLIAEAGDGSLRDAESIFDQVVIYTEGNLTLSSVKEILGISPESFYEMLWEGIVQGDIVTVLRAIDEYMQNFGDVRGFVWGMVAFLRQGLLVKKLPQADELVDMSEEKYLRFSSLFASVEVHDIVRMIQVMAEFLRGLRSDQYERLAAEILFVQLMDYKNLIPLSEIRDELFKRLSSVPSVSKAVSSSSSKEISSHIQGTSSLQPSSQALSASKEVSSRSLGEAASFAPVKKEEAASSEVPMETLSPPGSPRDAFVEYLRRSTIARQVQKDILSCEEKDSLLVVKTRTHYVADYIVRISPKIAAFIEQTCHRQVEIVVMMENEATVVGKGKTSVSQKEGVPLSPSSSPQKKQDIPEEKDHPPSSSLSPSPDKDVVEYVEDLFKAKKYS